MRLTWHDYYHVDDRHKDATWEFWEYEDNGTIWLFCLSGVHKHLTIAQLTGPIPTGKRVTPTSAAIAIARNFASPYIRERWGFPTRESGRKLRRMIETAPEAVIAEYIAL